jgi:thioester reductase-like protein
MPKQERGDVYFLTGFPTFLAKNLIEGILAWEPNGIIALLVQDKHASAAKNFIRKIGAVQRVRVIIGDVLKMHLGLSSEEYKVLTKNVTVIFHAASISYPGAPESVARMVNVDGTLNVLEFAADAKNLKRLNHFSSAFVSGDRTGVVTEEELDCGQGFANHIQKTKYLGELEVRKAMPGLPISVFRPSMVVGNSITGETDKLEGFYSFVKMIIAPGYNFPLPVPRGGMAPLNVVPVDYVVEAALYIASSDASAGKTFHLVDPNPLTVRQVLNNVAEKSGRTRPAIITMPADMIAAMSRIKWISNLSPAYMNALGILGRFTVYNCPNTTAALKSTKVHCPSFDAYSDRMLSYVKSQLTRQAEEKTSRELKDPLA